MASQSERYFNTRNLTKYVIWSLYIWITVNIISLISSILRDYQLLFGLDNTLKPSSLIKNLKEINFTIEIWINYFLIISFILCIIFIGRWIYKTSQNAVAAGASGLKFSPLWSVGWYFIPVFCYVWPWVAFKQMYQVSKAVSEDDGGIPRQWWNVKVPPILVWWWSIWLLVNIIDHTLIIKAEEAGGFGIYLGESAFQFTIVGLISLTLHIVLGLVFLTIVKEFPEIWRDRMPLRGSNRNQFTDSQSNKVKIPKTPIRDKAESHEMASKTQNANSNLSSNVLTREDDNVTKTVQDRLRKLKDIYDDGLIDQKEYQDKKINILKDL